MDQQELANIMSTLQMRIPDFAVLLEIGSSRLSSYVHGRTASVPRSVMDRARELYGDQRHSVSAVKSQFDRPMKEIVEDWDEQLGSQSDVELARFLGVTTMTIHRWRTNSAKPDLTALVRYNQLVTMLLRQMRGGRQQVQTSAKARANRR